MVDIDYGSIHIKLAEIMQEQKISISRLASRSETQRTQLKAYINNNVQRLDISVLSRLCYALECTLDELIEYIPAEKKSN